MSATDILLVTLAGLAAGFLNAISGGGAMLTVPALILIGLPPGVANGTNRLAVVAQSLTALAAYSRLDNTDMRLAGSLTLPAMLGAAGGALVSVRLDDTVFQNLLAGMMLVLLVPVLFESSLDTSRFIPSGSRRAKRVLQGVMFGIGLYGGLLQIGAGLFALIALNALGGLPLVLANGVKVVIVTALTGVALGIFILDGKVDWGVGLLLAATTSVGAWCGAHWGVRKGDVWIRFVVAATVIVMALQLLDVGSLLGWE